MKVLKFGGSSVAKPERIKHIGKLLQERLQNGEHLAVVFSAFGGVTDTLISMAKQAEKGEIRYLEILKTFTNRHNEALEELMGREGNVKVFEALNGNHNTLKELLRGVYLVREASLRTMDYILSFGERNSCYIISEYLNSIGLDTEYLDARQILKTNKNFGAAVVDFKLTNRLISEYFEEHNPTQIITGFIATDIGGLTTTLGRGGSDYTASIIAGALEAEKLEIWTDVDGVLTCDPRKVKQAYTIDSLSYNEAMELSHFGAKVIYPPTIQPALLKNIPIYIKNTFNPTFPGTRISEEADEYITARIKGLSSMSGVGLLTLQGPGMMGVTGIAARFFGSLAREGVNVIMITQGSSEHSICVAIKQDKRDKAIKAVQLEFENEIENGFIEPLQAEDELSILAIVGENMRQIPGVAGRLFDALGKNGINVKAIAQGSSELNISFAIMSVDEKKALNLIHDSFFLSNLKTVNVFMIGVGLIGGTLLKQILGQHQHLTETQKLQINIAGLANTKKMVFDDQGIELADWKSSLDHSELPSDVDGFIQKMIEMNLANTVFIDNTANQSLPDFYEQILNANISISTPNKVATSSSFSSYQNLQKIAQQKNIDFLYETNVGAGLPVLSTMRTLIQSGDKIEKIEAVLSGSVSYIFNKFNSGVRFHDLVLEAKELGYTEPDPRDDLSGSDIKRKILILSREAGSQMEPSEVEVEAILPKPSIEAPTVEAFMQSLLDHNDHFVSMITKAESNNQVLRYIATFEHGKAKVALGYVDATSPFYGLKGSDNMIVFTTSRYKDRPLVVRGPGAGAEVTAAGVFSEIISIGNKNHFGLSE